MPGRDLSPLNINRPKAGRKPSTLARSRAESSVVRRRNRGGFCLENIPNWMLNFTISMSEWDSPIRDRLGLPFNRREVFDPSMAAEMVPTINIRQLDAQSLRPTPQRRGMNRQFLGGRPPGRTRRAQLPRLTRKREQVLLVTVGTLHPGEAVLIKAAVQVPPHLIVDETPPEPVPPFEALLPLPPHLVVMRLDETIQRCRARIPRPNQATRLCGQDDAPCLPQLGRTSPACPHFDQQARNLAPGTIRV